MKAHWLDRPRIGRRLWWAFLGTLGALLGAEMVVALHPHFGPDALFGFHAWYGLIACAAIIALAKAAGLLLKRRDDYYEPDHE